MKKLKIDLGELAVAFETDMSMVGEGGSYLDTQTGEVIMLSGDLSISLVDFGEEDGAGSENEVAAFEAWLDTRDLPDWQKEQARTRYEIDRDENKRYVAIPLIDSHEGYQQMVEFAQTVTDEHLLELLSVALNGRGAFRRFKDVLADHSPEERARWFAYKDERVKEEMLDWLRTLGIEPLE
jgi:hypothetical protein